VHSQNIVLVYENKDSRLRIQAYLQVM